MFGHLATYLNRTTSVLKFDVAPLSQRLHQIWNALLIFLKSRNSIEIRPTYEGACYEAGVSSAGCRTVGSMRPNRHSVSALKTPTTLHASRIIWPVRLHSSIILRLAVYEGDTCNGWCIRK